MIRCGDFRLHVVSDGEFRLDGGAMFGVVPRVLWERQKRPDEKNRIRMGTNCLLIETGRELVLVDTGLGDKNDARFQEQFAYEAGARRLPESIAAAGFEVGDVDHVVLSHLHFDHCGWNTRLDNDRLVPTFPRARYWMNRGEVEHARLPNERDRASYDGRNWDPLFEAGVVELFGGGETEIVPGVVARKTPGHNADMCVVRVDGGARRAIFWADLVPTTAHVPFPWVMGYDLYPLTTMENKQLLLPVAAREDWISIFEHDAEIPAARLVPAERGRFRAEPLALDGD